MEEENIKLTEIKTAMLLHTPFFASIMLDMMEIKVGKFPELFKPGQAHTAATDGKHIWLDEDFLNSLKLKEGVFLMCHEIGHAMWMHMDRGKHYKDVGFDGKDFNADKWNRAGDYVINDMLVQSKIGTMPQGGLLDSYQFPFDMLVDDVYRKLEDEDDDGQGGGSGTLDQHVLAQSAVGSAEMKRVVKTAADAAKSQGQLPATLERFVDQLLNPVVPWQEKLRHAVTKAVGRDAHTWSRPHRRRLVNQGVILPSYTGFGAGVVVVAVDTSGSIGQTELTRFLSELNEILDSTKPEQLWILGIDAKVHDVTCLYSGDSLQDNPPPLHGGGGTAFEPAFEWVAEEGLEPCALVYFTDMYGSFPSSPPGYPVIWCATTDHEAPWGELIRIDLDQKAE